MERFRDPEPSGRGARDPGPAPPAGGPRRPRPPGGGGEDQLGARRSPALGRAPRPGAPPRRPDGASRARLAEAASGVRAAAPASARARIFFKRLKLSSFPRFSGSLLAGIALLIPAGRPGAIPPRGFSVAGLTSRARGPVALTPRRSPARAALPLRRAPSSPGGRPARLPCTRRRTGGSGLTREELGPPRTRSSSRSAEGRPLGGETSLSVVGGLLD